MTWLVDMSQVAAELRATPPTHLPLPKQGSFGNCWLLAAVAALLSFYPRLLLDMITLNENSAIARLPNRPPIHMTYELPHNIVCIRDAVDL